MAVQQNTDHLQTTHIGSLPRPHNLLDLLKAKYAGQPYDERQLNSMLMQAVADCVRKQVECGIEIVTDGEYSKPGFFTYIRERFVLRPSGCASTPATASTKVRGCTKRICRRSSNTSSRSMQARSASQRRTRATNTNTICSSA